MNRFTTLLSVFCQVFEWPTQRPVSISPSVVEAKSDKSRDVVLYLDGRKATQVLSGSSRVYESKTCKIYSVAFLVRYMKFVPMKSSHYTVSIYK